MGSAACWQPARRSHAPTGGSVHARGYAAAWMRSRLSQGRRQAPCDSRASGADQWLTANCLRLPLVSNPALMHGRNWRPWRRAWPRCCDQTAPSTPTGNLFGWSVTTTFYPTLRYSHLPRIRELRKASPVVFNPTEHGSCAGSVSWIGSARPDEFRREAQGDSSIGRITSERQ